MKKTQTTTVFNHVTLPIGKDLEAVKKFLGEMAICTELLEIGEVVIRSGESVFGAPNLIFRVFVYRYPVDPNEPTVFLDFLENGEVEPHDESEPEFIHWHEDANWEIACQKVKGFFENIYGELQDDIARSA